MPEGPGAIDAPTAMNDTVGHGRTTATPGPSPPEHSRTSGTRRRLPTADARCASPASTGGPPSQENANNNNENDDNDDGHAQPPPSSRQRLTKENCCSCSRHATCTSAVASAKSPSCACLLANRKCTSCLCFKTGCRRKLTAVSGTTGTIQGFFARGRALLTSSQGDESQDTISCHPTMDSSQDSHAEPSQPTDDEVTTTTTSVVDGVTPPQTRRSRARIP